MSQSAQPIIGIIGGKGRVGTVIADILKDAGYGVHISDIGTEVSNQELTSKSDIIFIAVPIHTFEGIAKEIGSTSRAGQVFIHVCSTADTPLQLLKKYCHEDAQCSFAHPMFDPGQWAQSGNRLVTESAVLENPNLAFLKNTLFKGLTIMEATAQHHDKMTSMIQAFPQLMQFAIALTFAKTDIAPDEVFNYKSHSKFYLQMLLIKRLLHQSPHLYGNILFGSEEALQNTKIFVKLFREIADLNAREFFAQWEIARKPYEDLYTKAGNRISVLTQEFKFDGEIETSHYRHELSELPSTMQTVLTLTMAALLKEVGTSFNELEQYSTPIFSLIRDLTASIFCEKGVLAFSEYSIKVFTTMADVLEDIVEGNIDSYVLDFEKTHQFIGVEACNDAFEKSGGMIATYKTLL